MAFTLQDIGGCNCLFCGGCNPCTLPLDTLTVTFHNYVTAVPCNSIHSPFPFDPTSCRWGPTTMCVSSFPGCLIYCIGGPGKCFAALFDWDPIGMAFAYGYEDPPGCSGYTITALLPLVSHTCSPLSIVLGVVGNFTFTITYP